MITRHVDAEALDRESKGSVKGVLHDEEILVEKEQQIKKIDK